MKGEEIPGFDTNNQNIDLHWMKGWRSLSSTPNIQEAVMTLVRWFAFMGLNE